MKPALPWQPAASGAAPRMAMAVPGLTRRRFLGATGAAVALASWPALSHGRPRQASLAVLAESRVDLRSGQAWTLEALRAAVARVRELEPTPRAILFLGGLTANGTREELERGAETLLRAGLPVHAVPGPADRSVDGGRAWREQFGPATPELDVGGTRVLFLDTAGQDRGGGTTRSAAFASELAGLASARHGRFVLGAQQRAWVERWLAELDPQVPLVVASHASLLPLYPAWNFCVDDAGPLIERFDRHCSVTLLTGQVRCELRGTWGRGHGLYGVPATAHGQPAPRAVCRALDLERRTNAARPGLLLVGLGDGRPPGVDVVEAAGGFGSWRDGT